MTTDEEPRFTVRPWVAPGAVLEINDAVAETTIAFDSSEALSLALELLRVSQPKGRWYDPMWPSRWRWRILEHDDLITIEFEDGFQIDRFACPVGIVFDRSHYRPDGSCRCPEEDK